MPANAGAASTQGKGESILIDKEGKVVKIMKNVGL